jgi:Carboxypeptidase regulatory-like domain
VTGKSGRYQVTHVPAGRWTLDPSLCLTGSAVLPGLGEMPALAGLTRHGVVVRNGSSTGASFRLPAAGRITGTVTGGAPAAAEPGLCVEATPSTGAGEPDATITNAQGGYTLGGLAAGRYRVLVTPLCVPGTAALVPQWYNGQPASGTATPVSVTAGATTAGVNASLVADGGISGTVTGSPAAAVAGVCVGAYAGTSSAPTAVAITGADGSYQLGSLPPRTYTIEFSAGCGAASYTTQWFSDATSRAAATPVTVTAGAVTGDISAG